jgi:cysteine protease ATG4
MKLNNNIWLFGKKFLSKNDDKFLLNLRSIPLFTYKTGFEPIYPTELDSDIGWGCMIRSGQMMVAHCFINTILGDDWRLNDNEIEYINILDKFNDNTNSTYSIHNICTVAAYMGVPIGSWFSPTITSLSLELINNEEDDSMLDIIVFQDGIIEKEKIVKSIKSNKKILILLPIMFGLNNITDKYITVLLKLFEFKLFTGIIGGKPNTSMYFIGKSNSKLLYLDPHNVKSYKKEMLYKNNITNNVNLLEVNELDPSMVLGFLVKSNEEIEMLDKYMNENFNTVDFPICFGSKKNIENIEFHKKENDWEFISQ